MRRFELLNANGEVWNLTEEKSFLQAPKMTTERKISYIQAGNTSMKTEDYLKQKCFQAQVVFEGYELYDKFCYFIQYRPLELVYTAAGRYHMQIEIEKLTKTELEDAGLIVDMTIRGVTTWYQKIWLENVTSAAGKRYPYTYPYTYSDMAQGSIEFESNSVEASPIRLSIVGPCLNPEWEIYTNGIKRADGKVLCSIPQGHRLIVDATKIPYEIAEYDSCGVYVKSWYQSSDFSTIRFLHAGCGKNKVVCRHELTTVMKMGVEVRIEYAAV